MFIDTHCHINMMVKKEFDRLMTDDEILNAKSIIESAKQNNVKSIVNVGTSLLESSNCIKLAQTYDSVFATPAIHPNDLNNEWKTEFENIKKLVLNKKENKIVGIGECGLDKHYKGYDIQKQTEAFHMHIELALEHNLPLVVHTRDAASETLAVLQEYKNTNLHGVIHCFSENQTFADTALDLGFVLGIGGPLTYPANNELRTIFKRAPLERIILETDAPFLPPQIIRGKQNHPQQIATIAHYLAELRQAPIDIVEETIEKTTKKLFAI